MLKLNFENHTNIKCDLVLKIDESTVTCSAHVKSDKDVLEVGCEFDFGTVRAKLVEARFNTENDNVYYVFNNKKEAF